MFVKDDRKPKWAWSSVDDPDPYYPTCDRCDAFARWSIGEFENDYPASPTIRYFACGRHIGGILTDAAWVLDALEVYDLTHESERG